MPPPVTPTDENIPIGWAEVATLTWTKDTYTEATVGNFAERNLYIFRAQAVNSVGKSGWTDAVYAYTHTACPSIPYPVAWNHVEKYLHDGILNYVICDPADHLGSVSNPDLYGPLPLPAGQSDVITGAKLKQYIGVWDDAVKWEKADGRNIIQVTGGGTTAACTAGDKERLTGPIQVMAVTKLGMDNICGETASGCTYYFYNRAADPAKIVTASILLRENPVVVVDDWATTNAAGCTGLKLVTIHEAGHAFGFDGEDHSQVRDSVMWDGTDFPNLKSCEPHPLDVVGVMSIYQ